MEEGERLEEEEKEVPSETIAGFASCLAASLLKETMKEKKQEAVWAISCSSDCHSDSRAGHGQEEGVQCTKGGAGARLCWTPESSGSQEGVVAVGGTTCRRQEAVTEQKELSDSVSLNISLGKSCQKLIVDQRVSRSDTEDDVEVRGQEEEGMRKGASEPTVWGEGERGGGRRTFLSYLGLQREEQGGGAPRSLRKTLSGMFHLRRKGAARAGEQGEKRRGGSKFRLPGFRKPASPVPVSQRALPPTPPGQGVTPPATPVSGRSEGASPRLGAGEEGEVVEGGNMMDFAASIERVKDHGWYWGPLSGEAAERILAPEPDGSFVVRDSSDHHYIFSLTFKLNGFVRHVRIEHDQGNFSFGSFTKFKSTTIVDFIENAVEHSRSGRYLFFLHRRPVLGPMRVQLLHPVSRFKRVQSLQHLCRYIIVKHVRKDLLDLLPVPNRIKNYLNTPFYYSEQVTEEGEDGSTAPTLQQIEENVQNWGQEDRGTRGQDDRVARDQDEEGVTDVVARTSSEP